MAPFLNVTAQTFSATATPAANLKVAKDFKVDLLYTVPKENEGSWVAMCTDPKGRLIVSDQYGKLYRLTLPELSSTAQPAIEVIEIEIGCAQGLLYAFDSLYVMVNDEKFLDRKIERGLYRLRDTNGDDKYDEVKLLRKLEGGGEHGPHAILLSPDKKSLHVIIGNQTKLTQISSSKVPLHWSEDHLLPRLWDGNGFMKGVLAPGGWIAKVDPDGQNWELIANGFRNEYDAGFNHEGELFTYDADMEWDINTPWYRPTRVNHVISGAEFGWRSGAGKYPDYYIDSFGSVVNVGPGSPTGTVFGYGAKFPSKFQQAFFICDWSFGKLYAAHLEPSGASYKGTLEEFVTGQPLALTDLVIGKDGAMYFAVGGRRTQSALYRVTYVGKESTAPFKPSSQFARERQKRRALEAFHGVRDSQAVKEAWPYLGHEDRALRFAARIALEWQDVTLWQDKALQETDARTAIAALVALARASSKDEFHRKTADPKPDASLQRRMLESLGRIDWRKLSSDQDRLDLLRAYTLAFTRLGKPDERTRQQVLARFDTLYPTKKRELNAELAPLLVYLESPTAAARMVSELGKAPTQEEQIDLARALRVLKVGWTPALRQEYFSWFLKAANFKGGASLNGFLRDIRNDAVNNLTESERTALKTLLETKPQPVSPLEAITSRPLVKEWKVSELVPVVERGLKEKRNFESGRQLFGAAGCASCHRFDTEGASLGPDLTAVAGRFNVRDLLESILEPSKSISDQYGSIVIKKQDGDVVVGRVGNLNGDNLMVIENMFAPNDFTQVKRQDIESIQPSTTSMMPEGLLNYFKEEEIQDLIAYLLSGGNQNHKMFR